LGQENKDLDRQDITKNRVGFKDKNNQDAERTFERCHNPLAEDEIVDEAGCV
jgi:hypothetical protein